MSVLSIITSLMRRAMPAGRQAKTASAKKRLVALTHIWYGEIAIGVLLLIAILGFDWHMYRSLVTAPPELSQEEIQKIVTLDERAVKKAADALAEHAAFLEHPIFPSLIQNLF